MSNHKKRKNIVKFERAPELNQKTKDSLHTQANKYGKAFFSPKHGVNVDPEDGVLSNRPVYSDGSKLTYESIDKPHSESNLNMNGSPLDFDLVSGFQNMNQGYAARQQRLARESVSRARNARGLAGARENVSQRRGAIQALGQGLSAQEIADQMLKQQGITNLQPPPPPEPSQPIGVPTPVETPERDLIQDLAVGMPETTSAIAGNTRAAQNIFGTPLARQKSVSKKYCKKNK